MGPSFYDRRAELNHHFNANLDSEGERIHLTPWDYFINKGDNFFSSEAFRMFSVFVLFMIYRCISMEHKKAQILCAPERRAEYLSFFMFHTDASIDHKENKNREHT